MSLKYKESTSSVGALQFDKYHISVIQASDPEAFETSTERGLS